MKICIDCNFYKGGISEVCHSPNAPSIDPVNGTTGRIQFCVYMRASDAFCGPSAKWFEPKTVDPGEGWRLLCNEIVRGGDEVFMGGKWIKTMASGSKTSDPECGDYLYRRRIELAIDRCPEGHQTILEHSVCGFYYVQCNNPNCTWRGNRSENQAGAAEKWNAVMRAFREAKK